MAQDIRDMFRNEEAKRGSGLPKGHRERFNAKLNQAIPAPKNSNKYLILKLAAVFVVAIAVAGFFYLQPDFTTGPEITNAPVKKVEEKASSEDFKLRNVSPEFKKVEDYYLASINVELAKIDITKENKELIDSFMGQLSGLDKEYKKLNTEIVENGINQQTVEAMITNLQMRLELLLKLKNKLKELKLSKNNAHENLQA